jgi:hypothetical protein
MKTAAPKEDAITPTVVANKIQFRTKNHEECLEVINIILTFEAEFMLNHVMAARELLLMVQEIETFSERQSLIMFNSEQSGDLDWKWNPSRKVGMALDYHLQRILVTKHIRFGQ